MTNWQFAKQRAAGPTTLTVIQWTQNGHPAVRLALRHSLRNAARVAVL